MAWPRLLLLLLLGLRVRVRVPAVVWLPAAVSVPVLPVVPVVPVMAVLSVFRALASAPALVTAALLLGMLVVVVLLLLSAPHPVGSGCASPGWLTSSDGPPFVSASLCRSRSRGACAIDGLGRPVLRRSDCSAAVAPTCPYRYTIAVPACVCVGLLQMHPRTPWQRRSVHARSALALTKFARTADMLLTPAADLPPLALAY